jgi:hypothetical protein
MISVPGQIPRDGANDAADAVPVRNATTPRIGNRERSFIVAPNFGLPSRWSLIVVGRDLLASVFYP